MLPSILLVQREYDHSLLVSYSAKSQAWSLIKIPDTVKSVALKHWNFQHCGGREILIILNFFFIILKFWQSILPRTRNSGYHAPLKNNRARGISAPCITSATEKNLCFKDTDLRKRLNFPNRSLIWTSGIKWISKCRPPKFIITTPFQRKM